MNPGCAPVLHSESLDVSVRNEGDKSEATKTTVLPHTTAASFSSEASRGPVTKLIAHRLPPRVIGFISPCWIAAGKAEYT